MFPIDSGFVASLKIHLYTKVYMEACNVTASTLSVLGTVVNSTGTGCCPRGACHLEAFAWIQSLP